MFSPDFDSEIEMLAFFAWRHIEKRRNERPPSGRFDTWTAWFKERYRGQLAAVRARLEDMD